MGTFLAYSLQTSLFLIVGYLVYKWLMASEKQIALNRMVIMTIYLLSFAAPLLSGIFSFGPDSHSQASAEVGELALVSVGASETGQSSWPKLLITVYYLGVLIAMTRSVAVMLQLTSIIRRGTRIDREGYTQVLLSDKKVAPFSWGRYIVMDSEDYETAGQLIISHELAHIRHRHCLDLLIAQIVCCLQWFNPAAWLLREELKNVHEFQADDSVISQGSDMRQYQLLLIKKAVGIRFQSIANSLNHSNLKKRITMMYNPSTSGRRRLRGLALVPAVAIALALTDLPAVASVLSTIGSATIEAAPSAVAPSGNSVKVTEKAPATQTARQKGTTAKRSGSKTDAQDTPEVTVEKMAQFPGGELEMMKFLADRIKFPPELLASGASGRVVVKFVVRADGTLTDFSIIKSLTPEADAEALRVIKEMPKWTPAQLDGKPVSSSYVIPVSFKQAPDDKKKTGK